MFQLCKQEVAGSIPAGSINGLSWVLSQGERAADVT